MDTHELDRLAERLGATKLETLTMSRETYERLMAADFSARSLGWKWDSLYTADEKRMVVTHFALLAASCVGLVVVWRHEWRLGTHPLQRLGRLLHGESEDA